jgi:hypothetical protein
MIVLEFDFFHFHRATGPWSTVLRAIATYGYQLINYVQLT